MLRATMLSTDSSPEPFDAVVLTHADRHLRRKLLTTRCGTEMMVDLARPTVLQPGDRLVLTDGRHVEVIAAAESLMEARTHDAASQSRLAWHIGNRHLPAQIEDHRIVLARDHVIRDLAVGLGAIVTDISEPFLPERGAYHRHGNSVQQHLNADRPHADPSNIDPGHSS